MRTVEIKEQPGIEGKTVGDKCRVVIEGTIQSVSKHADYDHPGDASIDDKEKKKPKQFIFYTIEFSDAKADAEYEGDNQERIGKIVDRSAVDGSEKEEDDDE